jgi:hypothetical protein
VRLVMMCNSTGSSKDIQVMKCPRVDKLRISVTVREKGCPIGLQFVIVCVMSGN